MILNPMWIVGGLTTADWTVESDQNNSFLGCSVSSAGDVNGDGYADVVVGANGYDDEGQASVYLGSAGGVATAAAWTTSNQLYAWTGQAVASAGDVNGDGFDDVFVGSPGHDNGLPDEGRAEVFHGSAAGLDIDAAWTGEGNQVQAQFGYSGASAGDVNGDGYDDLIVGAAYWDDDQEEEGRAWVYHGSAMGLSIAANWSAGDSNQYFALFGSAVASAGDVNGDGFDDVVVGAPLDSNVSLYGGRAYVYLGSATGLATIAAWTTESHQDYANVGSCVGSAGDVNADGFDDVIVGAPFFNAGESQEGRVSLFLGSATGLETVPSWTAESNVAYSHMGTSCSSAGDVNGDGFGDVVVGSPFSDAGTIDEGVAFVFLGTATGLETTADFLVDSGQGYSHFGDAVAPAGDVDGDGYGDILVGAPFYDNPETDEGRAYLFAGSCDDAADTDGDQVGDSCDACPGFDDLSDADIDGISDDCDVCRTVYDPLQEDDDADGIGDACDECPASTPDADSDGFCLALDCDDNNSLIHPGADELCDGFDNACAGSVPANEVDDDGDGMRVCAGDCDDSNAEVFPGQTEACNGLDDNCDSEVSADELDGDGDGYAGCEGDCDDANRLVSPVQSDLCADLVDNDCDGEVDQTCEDDTGCSCNSTGGSACAPLLALALVLRSRRRARGVRLRRGTRRFSAPRPAHPTAHSFVYDGWCAATQAHIEVAVARTTTEDDANALAVSPRWSAMMVADRPYTA